MNATAPTSSPVILGLWPIAGITTVGVTEQDARATIEAAIEAGVTTFDTAFSYGYQGESDRLIGEYLRQSPSRFRLIGKVGQRWSESRDRLIDGSPETLRRDAETSRARIGIDAFDLLMLHSPDPAVAIETSAAAMASLREAGICRRVGLCNATAEQRSRFAAVAGCAAVQCPLNLLQRDSLQSVIPEAAAGGSEVHVYWVLMKGLLAGAIGRDHHFAAGDSRPGYPIFQGEARRRAHDLVEAIQKLGEEVGSTVAQLSVGWALAQRGVTHALVGARRPEQIRETAGVRVLDETIVNRIEALVKAAVA